MVLDHNNIEGYDCPRPLLQVDPEYLKKHYASLSDEALEDVNRDELVGIARKLYDEERAQRASLSPSLESEAPVATGPEPDWLSEASCACSFRTAEGQACNEGAVQARDVLEAAGIPVHLSGHRDDPAARPGSEIRIMIPSRYTLQAESVLDHEIYNVEVEDAWKTHLAMLSDEEFRELDFDALISGLSDRLERLRRVYKEELAARAAE
jgi:hypothetical protein